jgi:hypothetical protein
MPELLLLLGFLYAGCFPPAARPRSETSRRNKVPAPWFLWRHGHRQHRRPRAKILVRKTNGC